jgi:hypothetical protein
LVIETISGHRVRGARIGRYRAPRSDKARAIG